MSMPILDRPPAEVERYEWKSGARIAVAPDVAAREFRAIFDAHGAVTPEYVIQRAKRVDSPLHSEFEWNNRVAGAAHREQQARYLMRAFVVVYRKADGQLTPPIRGLVKVTPGPADEAVDDADDLALQPNVYIPIVTAMSEEEHRRRYMLQALRSLIVWRQRYKDLAEFAHIFALVDQLQKEHSA